MKLRYSSTSPYTRKVVVTAIELGLRARIELVPTLPFAQDTDLPKDNPLGKIPTLITDGDMVLYDSPVICEYLASLVPGNGLIPGAGEARWGSLRLQALADGVTDAAVLVRLETRRPPAQQSPEWIARQRAAIQRGLDAMEGDAKEWAEAFAIGQIAVACALGYLDFRFPDQDWRTARPTLARWYQGVSTRASVTATQPHERPWRGVNCQLRSSPSQ
jgi:glutathione S-transferase